MKYSVRLAANFESNLESIRAFLLQTEAAHEFEILVATLFDQLIPNLSSFPNLGRRFIDRRPQSGEGQIRHRRIKTALGAHTEVREYIPGDYLVLYALRKNTIHLLSIKHHRQLSFELRAFWK
ncbi:MAG TPA: type II toxin-antitoxin system RelE/ParE family toxin [Steroidobacteraceae bacterium]|nr:type II toxin-antitoxin system RelE/ParE family toxin [Steroidobacteraceae bacterium]